MREKGCGGGGFLVHGNEKSVFLKEGEDCVNRTDGEGEDFSFFWKRRRRGCRQHSRTHCVALSRQQGAHYSTACRMNRRLSVQQPFRQDGPAERGWRCQSDAVLIWVPLLQVWLRLEMSTMVLGVRKRRHCERGEKGQTAPRVTLPLRSLCILRCRVLVSGFRASVLMKHNEWKIPEDVWTWGKAGCPWCHNGIIIPLVCTPQKMDESSSTQPCLLGQYLWVNKSCWDDADTVKGNLLVFLCFCLKDYAL